MDNPYNPIYRRAILNSRQREDLKEEKVHEKEHKKKGIVDKEEVQERVGVLHSEKMVTENEEEKDVTQTCPKCQELREALKFVQETFPKLQYLMLMETGYTLSPDFIRYVYDVFSVPFLGNNDQLLGKVLYSTHTCKSHQCGIANSVGHILVVCVMKNKCLVVCWCP